MLKPKKKKQTKAVKVKPVKNSELNVMGGSKSVPPKLANNSRIKIKVKPKIASIPKTDSSIHIASTTGGSATNKVPDKKQPKQQVSKEEKKRIVLERMIADREAKGVVIPDTIKQRAMSDNMTELQAVSKELQSKYRVRNKKPKETDKAIQTDDTEQSKTKKQGMTKRQEDIWKKTNARIKIIESYGYKIPQAIKDEVRPVNADYSRVKEVFKMLGGNLNTGVIDDNNNLYVKVGKENEFLMNVGLKELDIETLPNTYKELSKISRKNSPEYMKVIKGDTDIHTRIESIKELETVANDILSENVSIAKKNMARASELTPENIRQLEINKEMKKMKLGDGIDVDTKSVADDLVATFLFRFGVGKKDVQVKDIFRRLKENESVGYQLSSPVLKSNLNRLLFNKDNNLDKRSIEKKIKANVKNDVSVLQRELEETGDLTDAEIQDRLKEYTEQRTLYYENKILQTKNEMVDYVREKMIKVLSDIQSIEGRIDPHTSLQVELNKLIGGFVETNDENINKIMNKIKSRYDFSDDQLYYIEKELRNKIGNKNFMTRADLETLATQSAYEKGYFSKDAEKVKNLLIERFTDQELLKNWSDVQAEKYKSIKELRVTTFIDTVEDRLAGHPSWEQCKDLFYTALYDALLNAFDNLHMKVEEIEGILNKRKPDYKDQLYIPEYGERWIIALFSELKYVGDISSVISALKADTGWTGADYRRAYWTGRIKENTATTSEKKKSEYKKG